MPGGAAAAGRGRRSSKTLSVRSTPSGNSVREEPSDISRFESGKSCHVTYSERGRGEMSESLRSQGRHLPSVFVDAEEMKDQVRKSLHQPVYNVFDFYKEDGLWQKIARDPLFENITLGVIGLNALWIAVDTDLNTSKTLLEAEPIFQIAEHMFCVYFTFEWLARFLSFRYKRDGLKDGWFVFDSCLVFMMVAETWVMTVVMTLTGGGSSGAMGNASILRLFRLLRLSRMARMLRSMPELMILIKGMVSAMRSVFFVMCLLIIFMYVFAIAFTQLARDTDMGELYFSDVPASMYSLMIFGTFLDNLAYIAAKVKDESVVCLVVLMVFILLAALTVMNMLIGVLCEVVSAVAATEKESMLVDFVSDKLGQILHHLDDDGDMRISRQEFLNILENVDAARALDEVGVDPVGIVDFVDFIFDDPDKSELEFSEFMDVILRLRGCNTVTVKDIVDLRKFMLIALDTLQNNILQPPARPSRISLRGNQNSGTRMCGSKSEAVVARKTSGSMQRAASLPDMAPDPQAKEEHETNQLAVCKLNKRVTHVEDQLSELLVAVRQLGSRLPATASPQRDGDTVSFRLPDLPHLLHGTEEPCSAHNVHSQAVEIQGSGISRTLDKRWPCQREDQVCDDLTSTLHSDTHTAFARQRSRSH